MEQCCLLVCLHLRLGSFSSISLDHLLREHSGLPLPSYISSHPTLTQLSTAMPIGQYDMCSSPLRLPSWKTLGCV